MGSCAGRRRGDVVIGRPTWGSAIRGGRGCDAVVGIPDCKQPIVGTVHCGAAVGCCGVTDSGTRGIAGIGQARRWQGHIDPIDRCEAIGVAQISAWVGRSEIAGINEQRVQLGHTGHVIVQYRAIVPRVGTVIAHVPVIEPLATIDLNREDEFAVVVRNAISDVGA